MKLLYEHNHSVHILNEKSNLPLCRDGENVQGTIIKEGEFSEVNCEECKKKIRKPILKMWKKHFQQAVKEKKESEQR